MSHFSEVDQRCLDRWIKAWENGVRGTKVYNPYRKEGQTAFVTCRSCHLRFTQLGWQRHKCRKNGKQ